MRIHIIFIAIGLIVCVGALLSAYTVYAPADDVSMNEPVACTTDAKVCSDGSTVGRVGPDCEFAACPAPMVSDDIAAAIAAKADMIVVETPEPNEVIMSPLIITGKARGYWFFEASFPIVVTDWDGQIIGEGYATAEGNWMTEDFVPFMATISFTVPTDTPYHRGVLLLKKDNPSGLPEHDDTLELPILFTE